MQDRNCKTLSIKEASGLLGIGRSQVYEAAKTGQISAIRIGKRLLVLRAPLERMLDGQNAGLSDDLKRSATG